MHPKEITKNAWLVQQDTFSYFLREVYENSWGEVWLYNNDLAVFNDFYLFGELYVNLIGSVLRENIDAVKILLPKEAYKEFTNCAPGSKLATNLARLRKDPERLSTIYVASMDEAEARYGFNRILREYKTELEKDVWIFYTSHGELSSGSGIVMLRHNTYPFASAEGEPRIALCWMLRDEAVIKERLLREAFQRCFQDDSFFKHIELVQEEPFKVQFTDGISKETERRRSRRISPDPTQIYERSRDIDVAVISALPEEIDALSNLIERKIPLSEMPGGYYAELQQKNRDTCRMVLVSCGRMGNCHSAVVTAEVLRRWNPPCVLLVGICGGNRHKEHLMLGDIVVSSSIHAYEYQKLEGPIKKRVEREPRMYPCSDRLLRGAGDLAVRMNREAAGSNFSDEERQEKGKPMVFVDVVASGNKLIADDEFMIDLLAHNRKIIAVEMEGEGVMVAVQNHHSNTQVLLVKGVSDFADQVTKTGADRDLYREKACNSAARFVMRFITEGLHRAPRLR